MSKPYKTKPRVTKVDVGDWVMYRQATRELIGEIGGLWRHCKGVYNVGGCPVHLDDMIEVRKASP